MRYEKYQNDKNSIIYNVACSIMIVGIKCIRIHRSLESVYIDIFYTSFAIATSSKLLHGEQCIDQDFRRMEPKTHPRYPTK